MTTPNNNSKPKDEAEDGKAKEKEIIDIRFKNRKTYLAFQEDFVKLFKKYYKHKIDDLNIVDSIEDLRIQVMEKVVKKNEGFLIDTTPNYKNLNTPNSESTPYYKSCGKVLSLDGQEESKSNTKSASICFNCDQNTHSLRDCPEPRNMRKINKARNEFRQGQMRYHLDTENAFNSVPGELSAELRSALGLRENELPLHIYKMRLFGYPPGWLEEAKVQNSGLSMFVNPGKRQLNPDEDEGETEVNNFKYDVQKIHEFPGFNVHPSHPYQDLYQFYNVPPMSYVQLKESMVQSLGDCIVDGYKRVKLKESTVVDVDMVINSKVNCDMEVESDHECSEDQSTLNASHKLTPDSPSEDLEEGELSDGDGKVIKKDEQNASKSDTPEPLPSQNGDESIITIESSQETKNPLILDDSPIKHGHVDSTIEGCPVLPSFSGFSDLPQGDNFQVGVSDVIAFENLADSTGKYEHMKGLIQKVRTFQKHHLQE